ncbi:glycosyltransferase family 2 protein [Pontibacter chitinilyticus]|uniref:glycosyltransferase family 2 protein n=1 Tax=Pontibacter chitinilyticus TaxID=2674989 RepID=UPI00321A50FC
MSSLLPLISIITPCFNHGKYIQETVDSIRNYNWKIPIEHIIVNDGSTDSGTLNELNKLKRQDIIVIDQKNGGPSAARNTGIKAARGKYILPVDADNKIFPSVFEKAYDLLEQDSTLSVVYTDVEHIGEKEGVWKVGKLKELSLLNRNQIDTCALIKKGDLIEVGGYDEDIPFRGNEDWELWLRMMFNNKKFYYLEEVGFQYRTLSNSLSRTDSGPNHAVNKDYIVAKHQAAYAAYALKAIEKLTQYEKRQQYIRENRIRNIVKILFNKPIL